MGLFISTLITSMVYFTLIDLGWIRFVVKPMYEKYFSNTLSTPNIGPALAFYVIFLTGLVYFVILPAVEKQKVSAALIPGAIYGLVTYATYDLTSMAVFKDWPLAVTLADIGWGIFLAATVACLTTATILKFTS